jgi:phosphatidylserine/phosphatidylglycerophosphate/cardiolipin synthase-like enzyme
MRPASRCAAACAALFLAFAAHAQYPEGGGALPAQGTVQYAFTPGRDTTNLIVDAIDAARTQVLVQAYSFTHRRIAAALVRAQRRGVEVAVLADNGQTQEAEDKIYRSLTNAGIPVRIDGRHAAAHNKVLVIDADAPDCAVITGSFNLTYAAEDKNAENVLLLRGNRPLCAAYRDNWRRHQLHAQPWR